MSREREYAARLFLHWVNTIYGKSYAPTSLEGAVWRAADTGESPGREIVMFVERLVEAPEAWERRRAELEQRLDQSRPGSYLLWTPPRATLPGEEPDESEWVRLVILGASKLASSRTGEVRLPVKLTLAKTRDEGAYVSVTGGLSRYWTLLTEEVQGAYYLDSNNIHRVTQEETDRNELFGEITMLSQSLETGQAVEFEGEDAWSVQRLPRAAAGTGMADGWSITGCPEGFNPGDGAAIRRLLRSRLVAANEALAGVEGVKALVLIGAWELAEQQTAGTALRSLDPTLGAGLDVAVVVCDTEVRPVIFRRGLEW